MGATKDVFAEIDAILKGAFLIGTDVDAVERFEDEPSLAVETHVARLSGDTGASVLYGIAFESPSERTGSGEAMSKNMSLSVVIVRRLPPGQMVAHGDELAISDDLMDRAEDLFNINRTGEKLSQLIQNTDVTNMNLASRAPVPSGELDWNAREILFEVYREN